MNTLFFGKNCIELDVVDSTNNYAANLISTTNVHEGTVIMAHYQTNGRGQMGNVWHTEPSKNLTFSIVLHPNFLTPSTGFLLSKIVALSVKKVIDECCDPFESQIKWPNDIIIDSKKIAGILIENQWVKHSCTSIVGIGINLNQTYFEPTLKATSCALLRHKEFSVRDIMEKVVIQLEKEYLRLKNGHFEDIDKRYVENLMYYKKSMPFKVDNTIIQGTIENIDNEGRLCLQLINGNQRKFSFKEIEFIY